MLAMQSATMYHFGAHIEALWSTYGDVSQSGLLQFLQWVALEPVHLHEPFQVTLVRQSGASTLASAVTYHWLSLHIAKKQGVEPDVRSLRYADIWMDETSIHCRTGRKCYGTQKICKNSLSDVNKKLPHIKTTVNSVVTIVKTHW